MKKQDFKDFEIIVVSNSDFSDKLEGVKFLQTKNKNLAEQRNLGAKRAKGNIVAFIDDDAMASKNWLENLARHYEDEEVMCTGGKIIPKFASNVPEKLKKLDKHIFYGLIGATFIEWEQAREIKSPLIWGCNMSFRKNVFEKVSYFPPELGRKEGKLLSEEERYLQLKILEEGYKIIYDPDAVVEHLIGEERLNEDYLIKRSFWQGISEAKRLELSHNTGILNKYDDEIKKMVPFKFLHRAFKLVTGKLKKQDDKSRTGLSDLHCYKPWYNVSIFPNGKTNHCFFCEEGDTLKDKSLREVWQEDFFDKKRNEFKNGKVPDTCENCSGWDKKKTERIRNKVGD